MAKILGINALCYIGGVEVPQRNEWSLNISRELQEARVFQAATAAATWVDQTAGFRSWSGSMNGYYDDNSEVVNGWVVGSNSTGRGALLLYENRSELTSYWYGLAWFESSQTTGVDGFVELNIDFTGDGALTRFTA
jgi:hypothetical protein